MEGCLCGMIPYLGRVYQSFCGVDSGIPDIYKMMWGIRRKSKPMYVNVVTVPWSSETCVHSLYTCTVARVLSCQCGSTHAHSSYSGSVGSQT